jgi:hypothetical protein
MTSFERVGSTGVAGVNYFTVHRFSGCESAEARNNRSRATARGSERSGIMCPRLTKAAGATLAVLALAAGALGPASAQSTRYKPTQGGYKRLTRQQVGQPLGQLESPFFTLPPAAPPLVQWGSPYQNLSSPLQGLPQPLQSPASFFQVPGSSYAPLRGTYRPLSSGYRPTQGGYAPLRR